MRHVVLTRSAYGRPYQGRPAISLAANRARLALLMGITARAMAAQTARLWSWIVLVDEADPLLAERRAAFESVGVPVRYLAWDGGLSMYRAAWADAIGLPASEPVLVTRLDDDDALAPDALERVQRAAIGSDEPGRVIWMLPEGFRVFRGRYARMRHEANSWATLQVPPGDTATVYDFGHKRATGFAPVRMVDDYPGWLFVRHPDTISRNRGRVLHRVDDALRRLFPIDWSLLRAVA